MNFVNTLFKDVYFVFSWATMISNKTLIVPVSFIKGLITNFKSQNLLSALEVVQILVSVHKIDEYNLGRHSVFKNNFQLRLNSL